MRNTSTPFARAMMRQKRTPEFIEQKSGYIPPSAPKTSKRTIYRASDEQIADVQRMLDQSAYLQKEIAIKVGLSQSTVNRIATGAYWNRKKVRY